ncbi:putative diguanylate cyclase YdaM [Anatilimnocola aggregata]|uniref:diguanylate cyclase n=1 Tax=Anatilimnocola aggregata TaxID=2528021 RepID=A0A517YM87_9BACT|nr:GGDEF domain-containing protein [Anatilimnocola aggregata]QDU31334.1 putative diguanylate cyclase YdaM [Anatilimnocola aggregata]
MDILTLGLPASVALAAIAVIGYCFGQRTQPVLSDDAQLRRELKRARGIIRDLEKVAQQVRRDLATHQGSLGKFRSRLRDLTEAGEIQEHEPMGQLANETEKLLEPTQHLTERLAQAYELIRQQANQLMSFSEVRTDNLTGLGNRKSLETMLASQLDMHRRYGLVCSVAMFDIDHFKHLNTEQGLSRGDEVLKQVGQMLDQYARESDVICRYGGEEFVAVLPGTGLRGAVAFAERMRTTIEKLSPVTVSCGVAEVLPQDDVAGLLSRTDAALYSAKAGGRNQVMQHTTHGVVPALKPETINSTKGSITGRLVPTEAAARTTLSQVTETLRTRQFIRQATTSVVRDNSLLA